MYQFLYLFGPGVATWLTGRLCSGPGQQVEGSIFLEAARVIAYALLDAAVVTAVCKPLGRVQFIVLADGSLTVYYGATALITAAVVAVAAGAAVAVAGKCRSRAGH